MKTEIQIDRDIIILTTKTVEFLLSGCPDSLVLYVFYMKNARIQETNSIWNTNTFGKKGLGWGTKRYGDAKKFLIDNGFIEEVVRRDDKGQITGRYLQINYIFGREKVEDIIHRYQNPQMDRTTDGFGETNALSNKSINALSNKRESTHTEKEDNVQTERKITGQLPSIRGKNYITRLLSIYRDLFYDLYSFNPVVNIGRAGKLFKDLISVKTELEIAMLMIIFFNWAGIGGDDSSEKNKLIKSQHPLGWFISSINSYEAYARNVLGLNLDNEEEVRNFVAKHMLSLKDK